MSGKAWDWGREPSRDELRADATDNARKSKSRYRDRKNWCRGKVGGTQHSYSIRRQSWGRALFEPCTTMIANRHPEKMAFRWLRRWGCWHETYCTNCGRIANRALGGDCPDRPRNHAPIPGNAAYCWCGRLWPCEAQGQPWDGYVNREVGS